MKTYGETQLILSLGSRWERSASSPSRFNPGKNPRYLLNRRLKEKFPSESKNRKEGLVLTRTRKFRIYIATSHRVLLRSHSQRGRNRHAARTAVARRPWRI